MKRTLWILGSSGHARETEAIAYAVNSSREQWDIVRKIDANEESILAGHGGDAVLGMGSPLVRRAVMGRWRGTVGWPILVHPDSRVGPRSSFADGVVIAPAATVTINVEIGEGSMLNTAAVASHDVQIGRYCLINPNATVSGNAVLEDTVLIGAGAVVLEGRRIGEGAVVGAGAVVTRDVEPRSTVVGVPARPLEGLRSRE